ncbi:MAG: 1-deoxy-D-xylulose-5-phosphate synthase [Ruminococcaceae bacterium]|nr:1-deoxy-D-xylulose-5-phosphate synthase [Oscillospiraceae bacterium]
MMDEKIENAKQYPLLEQINSPDDLKKLSKEEIPALSGEIRSFLIEQVTEHGGHLASNLGAVELTLAIHRVFSTPTDHVIFDVGHQSYIHKLITGRRDRFDTLRQGGGLGGFPKRSESEHDCFGTGHSSTSLSAALGFAEADRIAGSDAYTVCVLGDGAYTGGMIHEALNNCRKDLHLIIVINENEMSISKNIGRFAKNLSSLRSGERYFKTKRVTASVLHHIPLIGKPMFRFLLRMKIALKSALYGSNYFENLGLTYFGPVDGNDEAAVERLLREAKKADQSCVIHLKTKKGMGYAPAEEHPDLFHGMSPCKKMKPEGTSFSDEMGLLLTEKAKELPNLCAITAAMAEGTGLHHFRAAHPDRFFDVGIAEEHAVTFAAGLSAGGCIPVVSIYSTFLQRAYDNIVHDVALQNLPVVLCVDRAGLNAADGATHHGIFDVAFLSEIPNVKIYTPVTRAGLRLSLEKALAEKSVAAIRYSNGYEDLSVKETFYGAEDPVDVGVRKNYDDPDALDAVIITHGRIVKEAMKAVELLKAQGKNVGILLLEQLKPYAETAEMILPLLPQKPCKLIFLEEEIRTGGMGMLLSDALVRRSETENKEMILMAIDESFVVQEKNESILKTAGLDAESIVAKLI